MLDWINIKLIFRIYSVMMWPWFCWYGVILYFHIHKFYFHWSPLLFKTVHFAGIILFGSMSCSGLLMFLLDVRIIAKLTRMPISEMWSKSVIKTAELHKIWHWPDRRQVCGNVSPCCPGCYRVDKDANQWDVIKISNQNCWATQDMSLVWQEAGMWSVNYI